MNRLHSFTGCRRLFSSSKRFVESGFSLIELLVVTALLALLMSLGVPALLNSRQASALTQAGGLMADLASLARQNAVSRNAPTALLIVKQNAPDLLNNRAMTLVEMDQNRNWRQITSWTILPESTLATNATTGGLPTPPWSAGSPALRLRGTAINPVTQCDAYLFHPNGRLVVSGNTQAKLKVQTVSGAPDNTYELIFNAATGSYKVERP